MVELFEQDERKNERQSSKGNQLKWENNGIWYKADYTGYEGLAEYMISHLLIKSTLQKVDFVLYDLETIKYRTSIYTGVKSENFLEPGWQLITLERLFHQFFGESLYRSIYRIEDVNLRLQFLVDQVERMTGLQDFWAYLNKLFTIDAVFLNEDRHTHNIAVLRDAEGEFHYCPIFDNGGGLLSDMAVDYPLGAPLEELMEHVSAKTVCADFDEQLEAVESLYGTTLTFSFGKKDIEELPRKETLYPEKIKARVYEILSVQMRKYQYLF